MEIIPLPCRLKNGTEAVPEREQEKKRLAERADKLGDAGTNDMVVSDVLRSSELQTWFLSEHLVNMPLTEVEEPEEKSA